MGKQEKCGNERSRKDFEIIYMSWQNGSENLIPVQERRVLAAVEGVQ